MRNTCPNQRSFWCWTHSSMEEHDLALCGCDVHTKGRDDFGQFIQKRLRHLLLFEDENDVICILQIDKVFFASYLNTRVLETLRLSSHYLLVTKLKRNGKSRHP
ncbi:hypothetical protein CSKR_109066 [Clonorchis sinensis]|uniref:Uncharacterized protein n=1 Tax=Clonorchis sinensis TaxID=79923 RepID=A0A419PV54_CLOSI|nr:hypothetical protein CSKR_109066 [Clonorchis sinensis]